MELALKLGSAFLSTVIGSKRFFTKRGLSYPT